MNQKDPRSREPGGAGTINNKGQGKTKPTNGSVSTISDVERFNQFITMDLRLPSSYTFLDLETANAYDEMRRKINLWGNALSFSRDAIRKNQKKLNLPPSIALLLGIPLFAFYISQDYKPPYKYCLPNSMPGLGLVLKKASRIDWNSVVGTQYFYQIDWKDVGISHYTPESAFVLFSPKARFKQLQQYAAFLETFQEMDDQTLTKTVDLVLTDTNTYELDTKAVNKANLIKRITRKIGRPKTNQFILKHYLEEDFIPQSPTDTSEKSLKPGFMPFLMANNIGKFSTNELQFENYSKRCHCDNRLLMERIVYRFFRLRVMTELKFTLQRVALLRPDFKIPIKHKYVLIPTANPWNIAQRELVQHNNKNYLPIGHILSSRDYNVLYSPEEIEQVNQKLQNRLGTPEDQPISVEKLASKHYWQPLFNSFDLIPTKMESMTFPNRQSVDTDIFSDVKGIADTLQDMNRAELMPTIQKDREKRRKKYKYFEDREKRRVIKVTPDNRGNTSGLSEYSRHYDVFIDQLKAPDKNRLIGTKTNTVRRQKHFLVSENLHSSFDAHQNNPFPMDDIMALKQDRQMIYQNKIDRLKKKWGGERWNESFIQQIPPLFHVGQDISSLPNINNAETTLDSTQLANQDPASKIFILNQAIQENLNQALVSKAAVRQSTRYLIYNSLFNFKNLLRDWSTSRSPRKKKKKRRPQWYSLKRKEQGLRLLAKKRAFLLKQEKTASNNAAQLKQKNSPAPSKVNVKLVIDKEKGVIKKSITEEDNNKFNGDIYKHFFKNFFKTKKKRSDVLRKGTKLIRARKRTEIVKKRALKRKETVKRNLKGIETGKEKTTVTGKVIRTATGKGKGRFFALGRSHSKKPSKLRHFYALTQNKKKKGGSFKKKGLFSFLFKKPKPQSQLKNKHGTKYRQKNSKTIRDQNRSRLFAQRPKLVSSYILRKTKPLKQSMNLRSLKKNLFFRKLLLDCQSFNPYLSYPFAEVLRTLGPVDDGTTMRDEIKFLFSQTKKNPTSVKQINDAFDRLWLNETTSNTQPQKKQKDRGKLKKDHEQIKNFQRSRDFITILSLLKLSKNEVKILKQIKQTIKKLEKDDQVKTRSQQLENQKEEQEVCNNLKQLVTKKFIELNKDAFCRLRSIKQHLPVSPRHGKTNEDIARGLEKASLDMVKILETCLFRGYGSEHQFLHLGVQNPTLNQILDSPNDFVGKNKIEKQIKTNRNRFDSVTYQKYGRDLLANPFRILPNTQSAFFANLSRDVIEKNAYQQYVDWYQHFFLQNLNFIQPAFELDHLLKPDQINAYLNYTTAKQEGLEETQLSKPLADLNEDQEHENLKNYLNNQKAEAVYDEALAKKIYNFQAQEGFKKRDDNYWLIDCLESFYTRRDTKLTRKLTAKSDRGELKHIYPLIYDTAEMRKREVIEKMQTQLENENQQIVNQALLKKFDFPKIKNLTLKTLFDDQLAYYFNSRPQFDKQFYQRSISENLIEEKGLPSAYPKYGEEKIKEKELFLEKKGDLAAAYQEVRKAFRSSPTFANSKPFTQSDLNKEIANGFYRSQRAILKSIERRQAESKTKKAIRHRIIKGHSPYLQRQLSGYLNPDASFKAKSAELLGWDNVFYKARKIYHLRQSNKRNWFDFQTIFLNRKHLSTINSPFFELTSPSPQYHYECFGRLINTHRPNTFFDFKQLGFHSKLKTATTMSPLVNRANFFGLSHRDNFFDPTREDVPEDKRPEERRRYPTPSYPGPKIMKLVYSARSLPPIPKENAAENEAENAKTNRAETSIQTKTENETENRVQTRSVTGIETEANDCKDDFGILNIQKRIAEDYRTQPKHHPSLIYRHHPFFINHKYKVFEKKNILEKEMYKKYQQLKAEKEPGNQLENSYASLQSHQQRYTFSEIEVNEETFSLKDKQQIELDPTLSLFTNVKDFRLINRKYRSAYQKKTPRKLNVNMRLKIRNKSRKKKKSGKRIHRSLRNYPFPFFSKSCFLQEQPLNQLEIEKEKDIPMVEIGKENLETLDQTEIKSRQTLDQAETKSSQTPDQTKIAKANLQTKNQTKIQIEIEKLQKLVKGFFEKILDWSPARSEQKQQLQKTEEIMKLVDEKKKKRKKKKKAYKASRFYQSPSDYPNWFQYYKIRGFPRNIKEKFSSVISQELQTTNTLLTKVNAQAYQPVYGYINHSQFDFVRMNGPHNKWIFCSTPKKVPKFWNPFLNGSPLFEKKAETENENEIEFKNRILLKASLTDPKLWAYIFIWCLIFYQSRMFYFHYFDKFGEGIVDFFTNIDWDSLTSIFKLNEAVVRCKGLGFEDMVDSQKLVTLFYPLILLNRNRHLPFGVLPICHDNFLQICASASPGFFAHHNLTRRKDVHFEFRILNPTEKEAQMSINLRDLRNNLMIQAEQKNCLLIGPPGTGKTFLVKTLSSECYCPVVIPSRYTLPTPMSAMLVEDDNPNSNPDECLRMAEYFKLAQKHKPCILFLDEIDSIGENRLDVESDTQQSRVLWTLHRQPTNIITKKALRYKAGKKTKLVRSKAFGTWRPASTIPPEMTNFEKLEKQYERFVDPVYALRHYDQQEKERRRLGGVMFSTPPEDEVFDPQTAANKVTQLLELIDQSNPSHLLIVGATNRPESLDPAVTRPGRLQKILYLDLPSKNKRLDLLKFYSRSRVSENIDWDYFSKQTSGLSAAHLKTAIQLSSLNSAYEMAKNHLSDKKLLHSEASLEYGVLKVRNTTSYTRDAIKRYMKTLYKLATPRFLNGVGEMKLWQHVSLGSPIKPLVLPKCELSQITRLEKVPTKTETQVWHGMPLSITRVSFPVLYHEMLGSIFKALQGPGFKSKAYNTKDKDEEAKTQKLRQHFYKRHRHSWRMAYLVSDPKTIKFSFLKRVSCEDHPFAHGFVENRLINKTEAGILHQLKIYIEYAYKVHMFGSELMLHSTYATRNSLLLMPQYIYKKAHNVLIRSSGQFTCFHCQTASFLSLVQFKKAFLLTPKMQRAKKTLTKLFNNPYAYHCAIGYNTSKALMSYRLTDTYEQENAYEQEQIYDLWSRFEYDWRPDSFRRAFLKTVEENLPTRKDCEKFLFALSAGKVGEYFMLYQHEDLPKQDSRQSYKQHQYECSELGRPELKQMSWLLNLMLERNLFYSNIDVPKHVTIDEKKTRVTSKYDRQVVHLCTNNEFWYTLERRVHTLSRKFEPNMIQTKLTALNVKHNDYYWWEPEGWTVFFPLETPAIYATIKHWVPLYKKKKPVQFIYDMGPKPMNYDIYQPNYIRSRSGTQSIDIPVDAKYLPTMFVELAERTNGNWNHSCFTHYPERQTHHFLIDAFTKSFYLLTQQRQLYDYLCYYFLRSGKAKASTIKDLSHMFLEPKHRKCFQQIEKNKKIEK